MANKALVLARKAGAAAKRKFEDQRVQASATSVVGGVAAAFVDGDGIRHIGETPINVNLAIGVGLQTLCLLPFARKLPFRAAFAGLGMGMGGVGSYILTHELQGKTELVLTPVFQQ